MNIANNTGTSITVTKVVITTTPSVDWSDSTTKTVETGGTTYYSLSKTKQFQALTAASATITYTCNGSTYTKTGTLS